MSLPIDIQLELQELANDMADLLQIYLHNIKLKDSISTETKLIIQRHQQCCYNIRANKKIQGLYTKLIQEKEKEQLAEDRIVSLASDDEMVDRAIKLNKDWKQAEEK